MDTIKEIKENLEMVSRIKNIASTYQDIANLRMNQIREKVLKNREFFNELLSTYQKVRSTYAPSLKKNREKKFFREVKKEKIVLFLSANQSFYGTLIIDIWKKIQKYIEKNKTRLVVVGKTGKYLAENSGLGHKIIYFKMNDEKPEEKNIKEVLDFVKNYKNIIVFHGKYEKVLSQRPVMSEISGELPLQKISISKKNILPQTQESYIFEPSAEAILDFFENEIIAVLFNQTILEHQLARYASRVIAMHQANENAKKMKQKLLMTKNNLKKLKQNKKQIELFNSIYGNI
jgi:F-type H+-transporting ATPase subunit gamma